MFLYCQHVKVTGSLMVCMYRDAVIVRQSRWPMPMVCKTDASHDWFKSMQQVGPTCGLCAHAVDIGVVRTPQLPSCVSCHVLVRC